MKVKIKPYGQSAILLEWPQKISKQILQEISHCNRQLKSKIKGVVETVPGFASLLIFFDLDEIEWNEIVVEISNEIKNKPNSGESLGKVVEVPICFDAEFSLDLTEVAKANQLEKEEVIRRYLAKTYRVHLFGFLPGFVYLGGLDKTLNTSRRAKPRQKVPRGSVAIGGKQTGIYPSESPGGWQVIGRTPLDLFSLSKEKPSPFAVGGEIQFCEIDRAAFDLMSVSNLELKKENELKINHQGKSKIKILQAGLLTSIQDQGRSGFRQQGVPLAGALDQYSARLANLLLGNKENAPLLEISLVGPKLKFEAATCMVLTGAEFSSTLNGQPIQRNHVTQLLAGDLLVVGKAKSGCRGYLALKNGFYAPRILGSESYCSTATFGLAPLKKGDLLYYDEYVAPHLPNTRLPIRVIPTFKQIRLLPGPEFFLLRQEYLEEFFASSFTLSTSSNRMALTLVASHKMLTALKDAKNSGNMLSSPVMPGTIQLPPSQEPIILMRDCQTVGGYPRIFQVLEEDMDLLGQCRGGEELEFVLQRSVD